MNNYLIPNLREACRILNGLVIHPKGCSVSEIAREHNLPRTSVLRIVRTLTEENYLHEESKLYYPGTALIHLGLAALSNIDIRNVSQGILNELTSMTGETSHLAVRMGNKSLLLEICESPEPVKVSSKAGNLALLHCSATGKVFIAHMEDEYLQEFCRNNDLEKLTKNTMTTSGRLFKAKETILREGYALDDEEYYEQVRCLAAPIKDAYGEVIAAIGITATITRFPYEKIDFFAKLVKQAAGKISEKLGYRETEMNSL